MTQTFLVLECPRCGGRLGASTNPHIFTCRNCHFDVMLRKPGVPVATSVTTNRGSIPTPAAPAASVIPTPVDHLAPYRTRLEHLKAELEKKKGEPKGCAIGCLAIGAAIIFMIYNGFTRKLSWAVLVGVLVASFVLIFVMNPTSPEEKALRKEIEELEKFIARSEQRS